MKSAHWILLGLVVWTSCTSPKSDWEALNQSPAGLESSLPWLFTGPTGRTWLSWVEQKDTIHTFRFSEATAQGWSEPMTIAAAGNWFVNWADYPMLVTNDSGKFAAHVLEKSGPGKFSYNIRVLTSIDYGKSWTSFLLNDDGLEAEHGFVSMVPMNGNIFFTWLDGRQTASSSAQPNDHEGHHGSMSLRAGIRDYNGNKIAEWLVDDRTCDCCQTTAMNRSNGPIVFYRDRSEQEVRDISVSRLEHGAWTTPYSVHADGWEIKGCPVNGPRVAGNKNTMALAWFTGAGDSLKVLVALSNDEGKSFSKPVRMDEGKPNGRVDVVAVGEEGFIVSWLEDEFIKGRWISITGDTSQAIEIAKSSAARSSGFPQMTLNSAGQLIFAWTDLEQKKIRTQVMNPDLFIK